MHEQEGIREHDSVLEQNSHFRRLFLRVELEVIDEY